jgi:hypothetical protein
MKRYALMMVAMASILSALTGCGQMAIFFAGDSDGESVKAEYRLPEGKVAILIDDFMMQTENSEMKNRLCDVIIARLKMEANYKKTEFIPTKDLRNVDVRTEDGQWTSIQKIGRQAGATAVLYVNVTRFELAGDPDSPLVLTSARSQVKVIQVSDGERLWPVDIAGRSIQVQGKRQSETLDTQNRAKWTESLSDELGTAIAYLFYDHYEKSSTTRH